ncbi:MAG: hypothetical protein LBG27_11685 [Spirochaetaceae bacterium]|jgi:hypothetical protein|nr:hypothetical protein [Spirochaetaceae bacterium]
MRTKKSFLFFALAVSLFQAFAACDMEFVNPAGSGAEALAAAPPPGGVPDIGQLTPEDIAGMTPEEIEEILGQPAQLTPEQTAAIAEKQRENAEAVAEMERNGRYLLVYRLPAGTLPAFISGVKVTDGGKQAAFADARTPVLVDYSETSFRNAYIPLVSQAGVPFARTGSFYAEFSVQIDALVKIFVRAEHKALVSFSEGRGSLDLEQLFRQAQAEGAPPLIVPADNADPAAAAQAAAEEAAKNEQIAEIVSSGDYIRFYNLPRNISKSKFSGVSVLGGPSAAVAKPSDYEAIAVRNAIPLKDFPSVRYMNTSHNKSKAFFISRLCADAPNSFGHDRQ